MATVHCGEGFYLNELPSSEVPPPLAEGAVDAARRSVLMGWAPQHDYPPHFAGRMLLFRGHPTSAGHRVFIPAAADWDPFVRAGIDFGVAVIDHTRPPGADPATAKYHAVMAMCNIAARHTRGYVSRRLAHRNDLVRRSSPGGELLLPGLGVPPGGGGAGWRWAELLDHGRAAYARRHPDRPDTARCIGYGLHAAAAINPGSAPATAEARRGAIWHALFADAGRCPTSAPVPDELIGEVTEAVYDVCHGRVTRRSAEPDAAFTEWLGATRRSKGRGGSSGGGNLPRLIINRVSGTGRKRVRSMWSREQVGSAFGEVCRRSFRYAGAAFSAAAHRWLALARRYGGITAIEETLFRSMYTCTEAFGGLPLAILHPHFSLLEPWLVELILAPEDPRLDICYTLLAYYAAIAPERRSIEATRKAHAREHRAPIRARHAGGGSSAPIRSRRRDAEVSPSCAAGPEGYYRAASDTDHAACQADLDHIAGTVARHLEYRCCATAEWEGVATDDARFRVRCRGCQRVLDPRLSASELRELMGRPAA